MEDKDNKLDQPIFVLIGLGRLLTLLMYDPRHPEISSLCLSKFPANADTRDMEEASHLHYWWNYTRVKLNYPNLRDDQPKTGKARMKLVWY